MYSMTGYGKGLVQQENIRVEMEIRSVNSRYCEMTVRSPEFLNELEGKIREEISQNLQRGKIDIRIQVSDFSEEIPTIEVNHALVLGYKTALEDLRTCCEIESEATLADLFRVCPMSSIFSLPDKSEDVGKIKPILFLCLDQAIEHHMSNRRKEGARLEEDILLHLQQVKAVLEKVKEESRKLLESYQARLYQRLEESLEKYQLGKLLEERVIAEMVIFADKVDNTEELTRLASHIQLFEEEFQKEEGSGKRLDFLLQEMNREVNTLGSKANCAKITQYVVDLKCELEKMREQVQNLA